jgi:hypothetical protein
MAHLRRRRTAGLAGRRATAVPQGKASRLRLQRPHRSHRPGPVRSGPSARLLGAGLWLRPRPFSARCSLLRILRNVGRCKNYRCPVWCDFLLCLIETEACVLWYSVKLNLHAESKLSWREEAGRLKELGVVVKDEGRGAGGPG